MVGGPFTCLGGHSTILLHFGRRPPTCSGRCTAFYRSCLLPAWLLWDGTSLPADSAAWRRISHWVTSHGACSPPCWEDGRVLGGATSGGFLPAHWGRRLSVRSLGGGCLPGRSLPFISGGLILSPGSLGVSFDTCSLTWGGGGLPPAISASAWEIPAFWDFTACLPGSLTQEGEMPDSGSAGGRVHLPGRLLPLPHHFLPPGRAGRRVLRHLERTWILWATTTGYHLFLHSDWEGGADLDAWGGGVWECLGGDLLPGHHLPFCILTWEECHRYHFPRLSYRLFTSPIR